MYKIVIFLSLMFIQCSKKIAVINDLPNVKFQELSCNFPYNIGLDSLFQYSKTAYENRMGRKISDDIINRLHKNNYNKGFDKAIVASQNYLMQSLGEKVYCKYLYLSPFGIESVNESKININYVLLLPNLKTEKKLQMFDDALEYVSLKFNFEINNSGIVKTTYPKLIPTCNGLPDCGINITKQMAIDTCYKIGFLDDSIRIHNMYSSITTTSENTDSYSIQTDGIDWIVTKVIQEGNKIFELKINLKNGTMLPIKTYRPID